MIKLYKGYAIFRASHNGLYYTRCDKRGFLRADTLQGLKDLINNK